MGKGYMSRSYLMKKREFKYYLLKIYFESGIAFREVNSSLRRYKKIKSSKQRAKILENDGNNKPSIMLVKLVHFT